MQPGEGAKHGNVYFLFIILILAGPAFAQTSGEADSVSHSERGRITLHGRFIN